MKKKIFKFSILIIILGIVFYLGYNVISKIKEKNAIAKNIKYIPEFSLTTLSGDNFFKNNLKPNTPTIFIYFNSDCDFCQHEAKSISENINKFIDIQIIFVSTESIESIKKFSAQYKLNNNPNIIFLYDGKDNFYNQFGASIIPYTLFYSKNQKLIKINKGQLNAKGMLNILKNNNE